MCALCVNSSKNDAATPNVRILASKWGHESFLWGHWYPYFGLLVTSPLGFKARVGSTLFELSGGIHVTLTCSLRFTSGVTPADLLAASMAAEPSLSHTYKALVGLETRSYHAAAHSVRSGRPDALPTEHVNEFTSGGSMGARPPRQFFFSIFMQFLTKIMPNNRSVLPCEVGTPICHWSLINQFTSYLPGNCYKNRTSVPTTSWYPHH